MSKNWDLYVEVRYPGFNSHYHCVISEHPPSLTPMWKKALAFLDRPSDFDGEQVEDIRPHLVDSLVDILEHLDEYEALSPQENVWGNFDMFLAAYLNLIRMCIKHPTGILSWRGTRT